MAEELRALGERLREASGSGDRATLAALAILREGGNAMDAALAAVALQEYPEAPRQSRILSKPIHLKDLVREVDRMLAA